MRINIPRHELGPVIAGLSNFAFGEFYHVDEDVALKVVDDVTLSENMRAKISLWSGGPLPLLIAEPDAFLMVFDNLPEILQKKFVGVRHGTSEHGTVFEEEFRTGLAASGYVFKHKIVKDEEGRRRARLSPAACPG